jgi:hypothetical protein
MKFKLILIAFLFLSFQSFSQTKNNISVIYGFAANSVDIHGAIGDYGYNNKTGQTYGLSYTRDITKIFSIETGLLYSVNKIQLTTIGPAGGIYNQNLNMLSLPVYGKLTFLKYLYGQFGFSLDHQTNYSADHIVDDQSGVGLELGVGGKCNFGPVSVFVNPYYANHRFYGHNNLMEAGVKFGLGYNF